MTEQWLPVPGFDGYYSVSDEGRVRSEPRTEVTKRGLRTYKGRILKQSSGGQNNYRHVILAKPGVRASWKVHRLVLAAFVGECPPGNWVRHLDGDRLNNSLSNLAYGTPSENAYDTVRHGTNMQVAKKAARQQHRDLYVALTSEGFSEKQALAIIGQTIAAGMSAKDE